MGTLKKVIIYKYNYEKIYLTCKNRLKVFHLYALNNLNTKKKIIIIIIKEKNSAEVSNPTWG